MLRAAAQFSETFFTLPCALDGDGHLIGVIVAYPNLWDVWDRQEGEKS